MRPLLQLSRFIRGFLAIPRRAYDLLTSVLPEHYSRLRRRTALATALRGTTPRISFGSEPAATGKACNWNAAAMSRAAITAAKASALGQVNSPRRRERLRIDRVQGSVEAIAGVLVT